LFLLAAVLQLLLGKHHQKEKRYGPSPSNNYTSGEGKRPFWKRGKATSRDAEAAELGTVGAAGLAAEKHHHHNNNTIRPSHETGMTGSTMAAPDAGYGSHTKKHIAEPTVPVIYDPEPAAAVHRPGYPHLEPAGHTHAPAAVGVNDGYGGDGYGRTSHGQTNL